MGNKTLNNIASIIKKNCASLIGKSAKQDITQKILDQLETSVMSSSYTVDVDGPNLVGQIFHVNECKEITGKVPGDRIGQTGIVIQRDKKGAIIFDPNNTPNSTMNIRMGLSPVYPINYNTTSFEIKKE